MYHGALFATSEASGDGQNDADRLGDERAQRQQPGNLHPVQVAFDLRYATPRRLWL